VIELALRNLISEKTRFAFSAAGIGFAVFLITIMLGLYQGWNNKVGGFVEEVDADVWIARQGTTNFINAASILPLSMQPELEATEGVAAVHQMIVRPMQFQKGERDVPLHLVGFDTATGVGGPPNGDTPGPREMIVDSALTKTEGVSTGDTLTYGGRDVEVAGTSSGGNFVFAQAAFMNVDEVRELLAMDNLTTFFIIDLEESVDADAWTAEYEAAHPDLTAFTSAEFASATREAILGDVIPIIGLIVGLALVVGVAITSLTIYTTTVEKTREFGVMKAIGFNNRDLYKLVIIQSMIIGFLGFLFGMVLTFLLSLFIDDVVPQFVVLMRAIDAGFVLIATLIMAGLAAIVPARRVGSVDPAVVFRG